MDSMVILGALVKGRSESRRLALLVIKFNSLVVAASFTLYSYIAGPTSIRLMSPVAMAKGHQHGALGRRAGRDCERLLDFCVTV